LFAILIIDNQGGQVGLLVERDDRQQRVARQRGVLGDVERLDGGAARVDAPVVVPVLEAQVKKRGILKGFFDRFKEVGGVAFGAYQVIR
jgi:hypothetical protein